MTTPIKKLKGITDEITSALAAQDIKDNEALVLAGASPKQRKALAAACGCEPAVLLELINHADLARVKGVAGVYADLLEAAGVDTVKELATRRPDNLHAKLGETNDAQQLTERPPTRTQVEDWVAQAKELPKHITY